ILPARFETYCKRTFVYEVAKPEPAYQELLSRPIRELGVSSKGGRENRRSSLCHRNQVQQPSDGIDVWTDASRINTPIIPLPLQQQRLDDFFAIRIAHGLHRSLPSQQGNFLV